MPLAFADTSFLISLLGRDASTAAAQNWARQSRHPIALSVLGQYEFGNAVRFAAFRKAITPADAMATLTAFEADLKGGYLQLATCDLTAVVDEAARLSRLYTYRGGHRSFDVLHVATARLLRATAFLTFDANQKRLAEAVKLRAGPI